jgi:small subunit ribosomal protein S1
VSMDSDEKMVDGESTAKISAGLIPTQEEEPQQSEQVTAANMEHMPVEDWDYQRPKRGELRTGVILSIRDQEIIVDVGAKRDGIVPYADMQRLGPEAVQEFSVGDEVSTYVLRPEDKEGNLLVSLYMARQAQAWERAEELADSGKVWETTIEGFNKGGVVVPVEEIRGFVPASQIPGFPMGIGQEERLSRLSELVGDDIQVKVIEINRRKRRLILSATAAQKQWRKRKREELLEELREGEVRKGVVSSLASFGAFVDLGGADGLVHISELSWRRVRHPRDVVNVGDEIEVYILRLDEERNRIGLSIKRLQPEPWALVEDKYELGQLVEGVVTNVVDFGAFAEIEEGIEGLIHVSELADMPIAHPKDVVKKGDLLLLRIIRIDARRKRLGLSLKRVLESEWAEWAAQLALKEEEAEAARAEEAAAKAEAEAAEPVKEAVTEAIEEPVAEAVEEPAAEAEAQVEELVEEAEPAEEPEAVEEAAEPVEEAVAEAVEEPAAEAEAQVKEPVEEPEAEATEEPVAEPAEEPEAVEEAAEPVEEAVAEAVEEPEAEAEAQVKEPVEEPEAEAAEEPVAEAEAEPAEEPEAVEEAAEPVEEAVAEAVEEPEAEAEAETAEESGAVEAAEPVAATEEAAADAAEEPVAEAEAPAEEPQPEAAAEEGSPEAAEEQGGQPEASEDNEEETVQEPELAMVEG